MSLLRIGDQAPEFKVKGILRGQVAEYSLASYKSKWLVQFFYPADFTFICPTEVTGFSKMAKDFATEGAAILGVSVDSIDSHRSWAEELGGLAYPLLSDEAKALSHAYGVLDEKEGVALRATFIINPAGVICYQVVSHVNVGRSVEETLRVLKALRTERLCPSDWKPGEATGDLGLKY
ncbi:MAG: thioredoxin peroxidase [Deltaproteobacteria bacterium]|nr:thioredoxin peroxidase [Deltaproteobacteria bacterium]